MKIYIPPAIVYYNHQPVSSSERAVWIDKHTREMQAAGMTYVRVSQHSAIEHLVMVEGWPEEPEPLPPPKFHVKPIKT